MENIFDKKDLIEKMKAPLEEQYQQILGKIMEAINWTNGDIAVCFSGGKDSALVLDIFCDVMKIFGKTDIPVKVVWANTTNETYAMRKYIPWYIKRCEDVYGVKIQFEETKPANNNDIISVIKQKGLPFVSKYVSSVLRKVTKDMEYNHVQYDDIKRLHNPTIQSRDALREMGLSNTTVLAFTGWSCKRNDFGKEFILAKQWLPLLDIKRITGHNIKFSEECCAILKKEPIKSINYKNIMTGEQAAESKLREYSWLKHGCNYKLPDSSVISKPLGAVSLEAVLWTIQNRDIPLCEDYGKVVYCDDKKCWQCTGAQRTGCALCGFGIKYDPQRFVRLQHTDPAKVRFAFKPIDDGGLGFLEVCNTLNEYCRTKIEVPQI